MHLLSQSKTKVLSIFILLAISLAGYAQAPNLINYQGVARNAVGNPLSNQTINLRLSVHNLSASGTVVYTETRPITTNLGGLFSVQIGSTGASSTTGSIAGVNWLTGDKYLQVEIDPTSNNNYLNMGTVQLISVPYAFNAATAANALTVTTNANLTGAVTSNGNLTSLAASPAFTGVPTAPTAAPGTNTTQIATTEFVKAAALTGPTGAKGLQGLPGADGAAGAQGIQGIQGLTGSVANVAAISGTSTANGASITSGELSLAPADATNGGIVTTGAQIFAGAKTFNTIITGSINGNATTATKLATARNINGVAFDGSSDVTIPATGAIPYTGATQGVDLGVYDLKVNGLTVGHGNGNIASNTASGNEALASNTTGSGNTASGYNALYSNTTGSFNTATGYVALKSNTTGNYNSASGNSTLYSNTEGSANTASGNEALYSNTEGSANTASGNEALYSNTMGNFNTATGFTALFSNTTGANNTASGYRALKANTTGGYNTASGTSALYSNTTGANNTATGHIALYANTTGSKNTASGLGALYSNTEAANNTATGYVSLYSNTTGSDNTANGFRALYTNTTGTNNTASGRDALYANTTGSNNTASGYSALDANTTGSYNTAIGNGADVGSGALTNATAIGNQASVSVSNTIQLGNTSVTNVNTSGTLTAGTVTYPNISGTANQVLTTNGLGTASWQALTAADAGTLTGTTINSTVTGSSLMSVGTITTGVWSGTAVAVQNGGTGLTSTPGNGQIDIGNGTGFTRATLTAGTGISIATGAGTITITNTSGLPTTFAPGDMLYWDGSAWVKVVHGSNGQSLFSNNGVPTWGTLAGAAVGIVSAGEILSPSGRIWMDRNLGATSVATSIKDYFAYGNLYQWGRGSDGHELMIWTGISTGSASSTVTNTLSNSNQPVNGDFITTDYTHSDWRQTSNSSPWDEGVGGININPCPTGFSVPSIAEWIAEGITSQLNAFNALKLTNSGQRYIDGFVNGAGNQLAYWSKDANGNQGIDFVVDSFRGGYASSFPKAAGLSIRCIKN
jgi:trimeric autotransporter adhesin